MEDNSRKKARLHKSIQLFLSRKLKIPPVHVPSSSIPAKITSSRLLSTCRFPRTPSLDGGDHHHHHHHTTGTGSSNNSNCNSRGGDHQAATLSDVDRFLLDNFRSLYIDDDAGNNASSLLAVDTAQQPAAAEASSRSESSVEGGARDASSGGGSDGGTAVVVFSMDPYADFRGSMRRMIEMHHGQESRPLDWDFLEELLFYYLQLNDQSVHKYILKAFADLTAGAGAHVSCPPAGAKAQWADKSVRTRKNTF